MESTRVQGPAHANHQSAQAARGRQASAPSAQGVEPGAQAGNFMALLAAWDPELGSNLGAEDTDLLGDQSAQAEDVAPQEALVSLQPPQAMQPLQAMQTTALPSGDGAEGKEGSALAALPTALWTATSQLGGQTARAISGDAALGGGAAGLLDGRFEGLVAQTARLDDAGGRASVGDLADPGDVGKGKTTAAQRKSAGMAQRWGGGFGGADLATAGKPAVARFSAPVDGGALSLTVGGGAAPSAAQAAQGVAAGALHGAELLMDTGSGQVAPGAAPVDALAAGVLAPVRERSGTADSFAQGQWSGAQPTFEIGQGSESGLPTEGGSDAFADAIREEVALWVDQSLQKADLTITHEGMAVDVSVALQGNQAHVNFVAEQAQTRELLDAGLAQLRELLQQHGLELAGVSVGVANQNQQGSGDANPAQAGASNPGSAQNDAAGKERMGVRVLTDRAVDLYV